MAVNKNFVVKNGLEVGTDLILANTNNSRVGIGTSLPTDTLHVNGGIAGTDFVISGIATIPTLNSTTGTITNLSATTISMGSTAIVNSARQLQNIASLDDTTTATIEAAIEAGPNTFANLNITGVSTFVGLATFGSGIEVQSGVSTFTGGVVASTAKVSDLTPNRVVTVGDGGELQDSPNLAFDGYTFVPAGFNVSGVGTFTGLLDANAGASISGGSGLEVTGAATVSTTLGVTGNATLGSAVIAGINTFNSDGANILGIVTATAFHGDISNATGVSTNIVASVGIQSGGNPVGSGITGLNFIGAGNSILVNSSNAAIVDISIAGGGGGAGAATSVGGNAPADPALGQLWYNNELARTFVYYDEVKLGIGASAYWVDSSPFDAQDQFLSKTGDNMNGALGIATGSLAAPGLYINGSTNTGIAAIKPNEFSFVSSGTEKFNVNATGVSIVGTTTVTGNINAIDGVFTGNVTVGGTLTKQDVTNVDSVGIVTIRSGGYLDVRTGSSINTNATGGSASGTLHKNTTSGEFAIVSGGTGGNNHLTFYTSASAAPTEKLRITSGGDFGVGTASPTARLDVRRGDADGKIAEFHQSTGYGIDIGSSQALAYISSGYNQNWAFKTDPGSGQVERLRITSDGNVGMGLVDAGGTGCDPDGNALLIRAASTFQTAKGHIMLTGDSATNGQGPQIVFSESGGGSNAAGAYIGHVRTSSNSIGDLVFGTRNVSGDANTVPAERLRIGSNGAWGLNGTNYGTSGQVIKSAGSGSAVAWGDATVGVSSAGTSIGNAATLNFIGAGNTFAMNGSTVDISISGGGGGSGDFNTGLSGEFFGTAVGVGSTVFTFPSTAGKKYILRSLIATNVATANTDVNIIGAIDFNGGERSYIGYNIPVPLGMAAELLRQPQVLNPSDEILLRSTDINRNGTDNIIEYYGTYETIGSGAADYAGVGLGADTLSGTTATTLYTSTGAASVLQSIRIANITDSGPKPVSVSITSGSDVVRLVENLIVPKYGSIEILDNQKRIASGAIVKVTLDEGGTMGVQLSAKKIAAV